MHSLTHGHIGTHTDAQLHTYTARHSHTVTKIHRRTDTDRPTDAHVHSNTHTAKPQPILTQVTHYISLVTDFRSEFFVQVFVTLSDTQWDDGTTCP